MASGIKKKKDEPCFHSKQTNKKVIHRHLKFPSHVTTVTDVKRQHFHREKMPGKLQIFVPGNIFFPACENNEKKISVIALCTLLTHDMQFRVK